MQRTERDTFTAEAQRTQSFAEEYKRFDKENRR
jgi:hypothetical protein